MKKMLVLMSLAMALSAVTARAVWQGTTIIVR